MTGRTFRLHVIGVIVIVFVVSLLSLYASAFWWPQYGQELRAVPSVLLAIGGAWLAFCWQRRVAFTKALFDVWQKIVLTVQDAIQYTRLTQPSETEFAKVTHSLSCRIDDIRGAFRNVDDRHAITEEDKKFILAMKGAKTLDDCAAELKKYSGADRPSNLSSRYVH